MRILIQFENFYEREKERFDSIRPGDIVLMISKGTGSTDTCVMTYNRFLVSLQNKGTTYKDLKNLEENYHYIKATENDTPKISNDITNKFKKRQNYK